MTRIVCWPAGDDNDGTSQYRLILPAKALAKQGHDVRVDRRGIQVLWSEQWDPTLTGYPPNHVEALALNERPDADVVVMQRPALKWRLPIIRMLQKLGIKVVVDVDDLFDSIDTDHPGFLQYSPTISPTNNHLWVDRTCEAADLVTASTPSLLKRYGHGHGLLLRNQIPEWYLAIDPEKIPKTIGWTGSIQTHPNDLQVTEGAVNRVAYTHEWRVRVVGTGDGVKDALGLVYPPLSTKRWVPFKRYAYEMARVEIGIVPLDLTPFNDGKSALKMMEYAACGVPVVASPTSENLWLHDKGVGLIAHDRDEWIEHLTALVESPELRAEMASAGRKAVASMTYQRTAHRWLRAWSDQ